MAESQSTVTVASRCVKLRELEIGFTLGTAKYGIQQLFR